MNQHVIEWRYHLFLEWLGNGASGFWSEPNGQ